MRVVDDFMMTSRDTSYIERLLSEIKISLLLSVNLSFYICMRKNNKK